MGTTYIGLVIDALHKDNDHRTRRYATWEAAHHAAVALAKRHGLYRYAWCAIDVEGREVESFAADWSKKGKGEL